MDAIERCSICLRTAKYIMLMEPDIFRDGVVVRYLCWGHALRLASFPDRLLNRRIISIHRLYLKE